MTVESRASLIAFRSIQKVSGVRVTYARGASSGEIGRAVPGDTLVEVETEDAHSVRMKVRDYLCLRSEVEAIIGSGNKPERGDTITEEVAGFIRTFDVFELGGEISRWWDKAGQVLRIHTVEVSKATTTGTSSTSTTTGA